MNDPQLPVLDALDVAANRIAKVFYHHFTIGLLWRNAS
jgi:hypothetical protein